MKVEQENSLAHCMLGTGESRPRVAARVYFVLSLGEKTVLITKRGKTEE